MALQKTLTHKGMTATNAYIKVVAFKAQEAFENPEVNEVKKYDVTAKVNIYDSSAKNYELEDLTIRVVNVNESIITFANIYAYLKTLDRFVGATNV